MTVYIRLHHGVLSALRRVCADPRSDVRTAAATALTRLAFGATATAISAAVLEAVPALDAIAESARKFGGGIK